MWFDTTADLPKKVPDFAGKKCFRCGAPATNVMVVGETSRISPKPVYAYVCINSPGCPFRQISSSAS